MAEYYWHDTPRKQRTYLCRQPIASTIDFDNPEALMWDDWLGFVAYDGLVAVSTNKWPDWRPITTLAGSLPPTWAAARVRSSSKKREMMS